MKNDKWSVTKIWRVREIVSKGKDPYKAQLELANESVVEPVLGIRRRVMSRGGFVMLLLGDRRIRITLFSSSERLRLAFLFEQLAKELRDFEQRYEGEIPRASMLKNFTGIDREM